MYMYFKLTFKLCLPVTNIDTDVPRLGGIKFKASSFDLFDINSFTQFYNKPENKNMNLGTFRIQCTCINIPTKWKSKFYINHLNCLSKEVVHSCKLL